MSEAMSPYQSPQSEMEPDEAMSANVSAVPKVIGILHLVFGGIGLIMGIIGFGAMAFKDKVEKMQFATYPEEVRESMKEAMQPLYDVQKWDIASSVGSLVLAILLIVAGLKLVRYRKEGLKTSNIYSALSIAHKVFALVIVVLIKAPAMKQVGESLEKLGGRDNAAMGAMMGPVAIISGVIMILVMTVYPILSFILLNKKQAKDSLR